MKSFVTHTTTQPTVESLTDYYPFGMAMPGRSYVRNSGEDYRYGFNGKENVSCKNDYEYEYRVYNSSHCRFLSIDPLSNSYPWYSTYQYAGNTPIYAIDLEGLEEKIV